MAISIQDLSLRQLQYVVAVADTLGFRRAAERCAVSQPTLSTQVQHLEDVLGVKLFERDRRRVLLTSAGEEVVTRARRILVETEDLLAVATRARDPFVGTFRVGVIPTIAPYFLPEVTQVLAKKYPQLRIVFREEKTEDTVRDLWAGTLDAGLVALKDLKNLKVLALSKTGVTDKGVDSLKEIKGLKSVYLIGTKVTDEGVKNLKTALPELAVYR